MDTIDTIALIIAAPLLLISLAGYIYTQLRLRPKEDSDIDEYYHEFESYHPALAKYYKWTRITFIIAVIAAMLLFIAAMF